MAKKYFAELGTLRNGLKNWRKYSAFWPQKPIIPKMTAFSRPPWFCRGSLTPAVSSQNAVCTPTTHLTAQNSGMTSKAQYTAVKKWQWHNNYPKFLRQPVKSVDFPWQVCYIMNTDAKEYFAEYPTLRKACGLDRMFMALCWKKLPEGCAFCTLLSVFRRAGMSIHMSGTRHEHT